MQNPILSTADATTQHQKQVTLNYADMRNVTKIENKATEAVNALNKIEHKEVMYKQHHNKNTVDKNLKENIAKEKLLHSNDAPIKTQSEAKSLEVIMTYGNKTDTKPQTAREVAVKQQDVLESVKSVKPDGTETYYFPVPVEILTQLPPPGNLGISAKMLEDIMKQSEKDKNISVQEAKKQTDTDNIKKIDIQKTVDKQESEMIIINNQTLKAQAESNDTGKSKTLFS